MGAAVGVTLGLEINGGNGTATITLTSADKEAHWYGAGFNASSMDGTYAIVVDGAGAVTEHKLGDHNAGKVLGPSPGLVVVSQTAHDGVRTTVLQRPLAGASADHYTFTTAASTLQFVAARGSTSQAPLLGRRSATHIRKVQPFSARDAAAPHP